DGPQRSGVLAVRHALARGRLLARWARRVRAPLDAKKLEAATTDWAALSDEAPLPPSELLARKHPSAREAGAIAVTKLRVELPILRALEPLEQSIAADSARNEHVLHGRVHERFASRVDTTDVLELSDWLYRTVFLMPPEDPWLGLAPDDVWAGIEQGGIA